MVCANGLSAGFYYRCSECRTIRRGELIVGPAAGQTASLKEANIHESVSDAMPAGRRPVEALVRWICRDDHEAPNAGALLHRGFPDTDHWEDKAFARHLEPRIAKGCDHGAINRGRVRLNGLDGYRSLRGGVGRRHDHRRPRDAVVATISTSADATVTAWARMISVAAASVFGFTTRMRSFGVVISLKRASPSLGAARLNMPGIAHDYSGIYKGFT